MRFSVTRERCLNPQTHTHICSYTHKHTHTQRPATAVSLTAAPSRHGMDEPHASRQGLGNGPGASAHMHGLFTDAETGQVTYCLELTDGCLAVQRITYSPSSPERLDLRDCAGSRAYQGESDRTAYLCAYFYPYRYRWMGSSPVRHRDERRFRLVLNADDDNDDAQANLREAERWARAIRDNSARCAGHASGVLFSEGRRSCGVMVLVNPQSGWGQAMALYNSHIQRMLTEAGIQHTLVITERQNHAREMMRNADLTQCDAIVILSGDGLLFEVVNGLMDRQDWEKAIQTPVGILPGGSGNALAASVHHYTRKPQVWGEDLLVSCGFVLCKGLTSKLDLISVHLSSGARLFSFLSIAWGFVADVDIESEQLRLIGPFRFIVGTLVRLASLRTYRGKLAFLPVTDNLETDVSQAQQTHNNRTSYKSSEHNPSEQTRLVDHLLVPLDQPVPQSWTVVEEQEFVLVVAMFQSYLGEDWLVAPSACTDDGVIHLFYMTAGISRPAMLRLFRAMQSGTHMECGCPHLVYRRAKALRLEPETRPGIITVDGEQVEYGPLQAQAHRGVARLITG
ncbi:sphingosine kinase 1 [Triplophysa dalaica]|uniref:sphingosine kinase 1 n=1 Tax=Triplophysa dalaica TaxID=1582913 RepID=UPI0024DFBFFE|nr:sphingosine kinase 1 [Triplophysa dalaica]